MIGTAGQQLVYIGLMSHVKNKSIPGGIEYPVNGKRQLHDAKVGGQMAARHGDLIDEKSADLDTQTPQRGAVHAAKLLMGWKMY